MSAREEEPWYRRVYRWGQTNLTELDPTRYDADWWRGYWRRTRIGGIIVNAAGIVYYYPSTFSEVHRAEYLGERDLFGEIVAVAHEDGLAVLARMDSNRVHEPFANEHPDWITRNAEGEPYRRGGLYVTCINSAYYREFLPSVFREIIERYRPEGFTDNSYSGLGQREICYCRNCAEGFRKATGRRLPRAVNWDDPDYKEWILWSYDQRLAVWGLNNRTTKAAGGKDCLWVGMIGANMIGQARSFRDIKAICERTEIVMLDSQHRSNATGFQANGESGKLIHGVLGWEKLIPESTAMYQGGNGRLAAKSEPEARMWALEGFAGTIQPWWHHISAYHEDRRQYRTAEPLFRWHEEKQEFLVGRSPIANVGLLWSQRNVDFFGRDDAEVRVGLPWRGIGNALIRARIPYLPVHIDTLDRHADSLDLIILPNVGALSDDQCDAVRRFADRGGSVIASGETSLYDEWGERRGDFALADLFGCRSREVHLGGHGSGGEGRREYGRHSYLRLHPELRAQTDGPRTGDEPPVSAPAKRHPALEGFEETDILSFGGRVEVVEADPGSQVLLTFIPAFPAYPPETSWMRQPSTSIPGLIVRETGRGGRVAYLAADIDRCYGRDNLPDHARLLANLFRWAAGGSIPLHVEGRGLIDCHLYHQPNRLVLHLVNLTSAETWRASIHELIPVGPHRISLRLPDDVKGERAELHVGGGELTPEVRGKWATFEVPQITDHEMVVVT